MLKREWEVHVDWCARGSKRVADAQASRAVLGRPHVLFFSHVPYFVSILVEEDVQSTSSGVCTM